MTREHLHRAIRALKLEKRRLKVITPRDDVHQLFVHCRYMRVSNLIAELQQCVEG